MRLACVQGYHVGQVSSFECLVSDGVFRSWLCFMTYGGYPKCGHLRHMALPVCGEICPTYCLILVVSGSQSGESRFRE